MKVIKNIRKRRLEKFKARVVMDYQRKVHAETEKIYNESKAETDFLNKKYQEKIAELTARYEQEIKIIREQERKKYEPIIYEREQEVQRLRDHINERKKYYEAMIDREYRLEETGRAVIANFQRGADKIQEGLQSLFRGQSQIEAYNKDQIKQDNKIQGLIKNE